MLGLGRDAVRRIPVDAEFAMRLPSSSARSSGISRRGCGRSRSSARPARSRRARSIRSARSRTSASDTASGSTWTRPTAGRRCCAGAAAAALRHRARRLDRVRSAQVALHAALGRLRPLPRPRAWRRRRSRSRRDYIHEDKEASGHGFDLLTIGPQFSRGFAALQGLGLAARARARRLRRAGSRTMRRSRATWASASRSARSSSCRRRSACRSAASGTFRPTCRPWAGREEYLDRLNERLMTRDPARRPRLLLERRPRRPVRSARLHRELPHGGGGLRPAAGRLGGARRPRSTARCGVLDGASGEAPPFTWVSGGRDLVLRLLRRRACRPAPLGRL